MREALESAVGLLRRGQCVGMPTETVYGLAADALNPLAVARVFEAKRRPHFDPLIVHVAPSFSLDQWVSLTPTATRLIEAFWPGPLTLLVPKKSTISDLVTSGHSTVALRCPAHPLAQALLVSFGGPLVAPSANPFGRISPTTADAVISGLGDRVSMVLDGGPCAVGIESTIVDTTAPAPSLPILRRGGVEDSTLSALGYTLNYPTPIIGRAPGTLKNHYAPSTPLYLLRHDLTTPPCPRSGYLTWQKTLDTPYTRTLTPQGDSLEAASRLFGCMRALDDSPCEQIFVEPIPSMFKFFVSP
jgi:L-threonylcarbamoyladenylate synthase